MGTVAVLSPTAIAVEPGSQASVTIRVRNTGAIVDRFDLSVVGIAAAWTRVEPASLSLFPGAEGQATITFAPPRAATPRAGTTAFGVRVLPEADPGGSTVEEGRVTVGPFAQSSAELVPQTSRGSRAGRHEVLVANRGNAPATVAVTASDPDRLLAFEVAPERAVVGPEERAAFQVTARAGETFLLGPNRSFPFSVTVEPTRQEPIQLRGTLNQRALLPSWVPTVGGLAIAAVALATVSFAAGLGPFAPPATPVPSGDTAQVSQPPSAPPSQGGAGESASAEPPSGPPPSDAASSGPSPTPPPLRNRDFTLEVTGDEVQLGNGLAIRCAPDDTTCRNQAKQTIRTIVNELANPYSGAGLTSTRLLDVPQTLPVVLAASRDFPWRKLDGSESDVTTRAVIDLGPLLAQPPSFVYAVVDSQGGQVTRRFVIDPAVATQLFQLLYQLPPEMGDPTAATPPPGMTLNDQIVVDSINWDFAWVLQTPTP